jgi:hypothetical protein
MLSYEINKSGQDYEVLYEDLKNSASWWHYLGSTWLIYMSESPDELYSRIGKHIHENEYALVIKVKRNYQDWLQEEAWEWIKLYVSY